MGVTSTHCLVTVDVRSAHNIGSMFRTCDGFGVDLCIVGASPTPKRKNDTRLPHIARDDEKKIEKTALGATSSVAWEYFETPAEALTILKERGYFVVALEQSSKSQLLMRHVGTKPVALVVGHEVTGLTSDVMSLCDEVYEIPMKGAKESFNVAVAASIGLYELCRTSE